MYRVAIIGQSLGAQVAALACKASGFQDIGRFYGEQTHDLLPTIHSLGANASRLLRALAPEALEQAGFQPDRYQVRFAKSAYLLAELPLGEFYQQRYGAPLINFAAPALAAYLEEQLGMPIAAATALHDIESNHDLTVLTTPESPPTQQHEDASFLIYHARLPDHPLRKANVLWRGDGQYVEQLSDQTDVHFRFVTRADRPFEPAQWHESLQPALAAKEAVGAVSTQNFTASDRLFAGRVALLHSAVAPPLAARVDASNTALEDAWVLSRMMENYEEDIGDGLAAFERFRRPRHRKVALNMRAHLLRFTEPSVSKRALQHVGMALQNRLLPEIALAQQDWLYEHDVIKGFR